MQLVNRDLQDQLSLSLSMLVFVFCSCHIALGSVSFKCVCSWHTQIGVVSHSREITLVIIEIDVAWLVSSPLTSIFKMKKRFPPIQTATLREHVLTFFFFLPFTKRLQQDLLF